MRILPGIARKVFDNPDVRPNHTPAPLSRVRTCSSTDTSVEPSMSRVSVEGAQRVTSRGAVRNLLQSKGLEGGPSSATPSSRPH